MADYNAGARTNVFLVGKAHGLAASRARYGVNVSEDAARR